MSYTETEVKSDPTSCSFVPPLGRGIWILITISACVGIAWLLTRPLGRDNFDTEIIAPATPVAEVLQPPNVAAPDGKQLYTNHCAQCHGDRGDGNGLAARFLYPKPRNFGEARFRLVLTNNAIPTDEDLMRVITRGMPGSAMFPFGHLPEEERKALVTYVRGLIKVSLLDRLQKEAEAKGEKFDPKDVEQDVTQLLTPGEKLTVPVKWPKADDASIARGKLHYGKSCNSCHGETGKGDGVQDQKDDNGMPTRPRDFTRGIFKGGSEPEQLFARIRLGMQGTPMPGTQDLSDNEICDLINYVRSLTPADAQTKVEHKRSVISAKRVASLPDNMFDPVWDTAAKTRVVVSPLWWREYAEPEFAVVAMHDGKTLAIRLTWLDATRNDKVIRTEDFEDMAAVQFFRGKQEPFLGMGLTDSAIDLWLWRATWTSSEGWADSKLDDYPLASPEYQRLFKPGEKLPEMLTARMAGNQHARADKGQTAASLSAKGFGTTTFLPKPSQRVSATSEWKDGRWTVVIRRSLIIGAEEGLSLRPGDKVSIAFATWDGAARDRNGQKLVSIWHDLKVE